MAVGSIKTETQYFSFLKKITRYFLLEHIKQAKYEGNRPSPDIKNLFEKIKSKYELKWGPVYWDTKLDEDFCDRID